MRERKRSQRKRGRVLSSSDLSAIISEDGHSAETWIDELKRVGSELLKGGGKDYIIAKEFYKPIWVWI